jgi:DNA-directed RNA polymerase subunit RPC12/RpoP
MYQICIGIKTATELRAEKKKLEKNLNDQWIIKYRCSKCGKEYASSKEGLRFCDQDGMRIIAVKERKES